MKTRASALPILLAALVCAGVSHGAEESPPTILNSLTSQTSELRIKSPYLLAFDTLKIDGVELPQPAQEELFRQLVNEIASSLTPKEVEPSALTPTEARTRARRSGLPLLYFTPHLVGAKLKLTAVHTRWPAAFWDRVKQPLGEEVARQTFSVPSEALVRPYLKPAERLLAQRRTLNNPVHSPLALACGDVDDDGRLDVVAVGRQKIVVGHLDQSEFRITAQQEWSNLSQVASAPLRAPLAAVALSDQKLLVGNSDRAQLVELDASLKKLNVGPRAYPIGERRCAAFLPQGLSSTSFACPIGATKLPSLRRPVALDARASGEITVKGVTTVAETEMPLNARAVTTTSTSGGQKRDLELKDIGDAMTWADIDGDGQLELLASSASNTSTHDTLYVYRLTAGPLEKVVALQTKGIAAIATCPFDGKYPLTTIASVGQELWVFE